METGLDPVLRLRLGKAGPAAPERTRIDLIGGLAKLQAPHRNYTSRLHVPTLNIICLLHLQVLARPSRLQVNAADLVPCGK